eukprot:12846975-Heterocapsa_arctica.AAC.1
MALGRHGCEPKRLGSCGSGVGRCKRPRWGARLRSQLCGSTQPGLSWNILMPLYIPMQALCLIPEGLSEPFSLSIPSPLAQRPGSGFPVFLAGAAAPGRAAPAAIRAPSSRFRVQKALSVRARLEVHLAVFPVCPQGRRAVRPDDERVRLLFPCWTSRCGVPVIHSGSRSPGTLVPLLGGLAPRGRADRLSHRSPGSRLWPQAPRMGRMRKALL